MFCFTFYIPCIQKTCIMLHLKGLSFRKLINNFTFERIRNLWFNYKEIG